MMTYSIQTQQAIDPFSSLSSQKQTWRVCLITVCIHCVSSIHCCGLLVPKVMAGVWCRLYSRHLSFLLSLRITLAQSHDRLSLPLTHDTQRRQPTKTGLSEWWDGNVFTGGKEEERKGGDHEMTARELKLSTGICLTFPWSCPRALPVITSEGENLFSIYFIFIWVSSRIFIYSSVPPLVSERRAVKCITLNVLT